MQRPSPGEPPTALPSCGGRPRRGSPATWRGSWPTWVWSKLAWTSGWHPAELGPRGTDAVSLLLAANPGLEAQPLAAVASGGELSRIALAIRVAARGGGGAGTMLLDEVDAGVGGRTARAVGDKLARLAASAQLICITHLPQIAGRADRHLRVDKAAPIRR